MHTQTYVHTHTHTHAWRETERMCKLLYVCLEADSKRGSEGSNIGNNNSDASTAAAAAATAGQKRASWRCRWLSQPPSRLNTQHKKPSQANPSQARPSECGTKRRQRRRPSPSMPKKKNKNNNRKRVQNERTIAQLRRPQQNSKKNW